MNNIDKQYCCGCGACEQICPANCIRMAEDNEGFEYPQIDRSKCINCHACDNVCPLKKKTVVYKDMSQVSPMGYGGWNKDSEVRYKSSSGGAFDLFAKYVIGNGGVVYGCILDDKHRAIHIGVDSVDDLYKLYGSKYVQSCIEETYVEVRKKINTGHKVLFVGTPCQIAGLYAFLNSNDVSDLYTMSFICHGVPSPRVFRDYIGKLEKEFSSKVSVFRFRNKDRGWNSSGLQLGTYVEFENGIKKRFYPAYKDSYMNGFLSDIMLRPSCYDCQFKGLENNSADIVIGDFWGVKRIDQELYDKMGTSIVLILSDKAKLLWKELKGEHFFKEIDVDEILKKNTAFNKSAIYNNKRLSFFDDYNKRGYEYIEKKYMTKNAWIMQKIRNKYALYRDRIFQFIKFGIVGISNTAISLMVYYIGLFVGVHYLLAYTIGFVASVCNAFYWNRRYVFTQKEEKSIIRGFAKTFISYGISYTLSMIFLGVFVEILRIPDVIAPIIKLFVTVPINYILNKFWAFKDNT